MIGTYEVSAPMHTAGRRGGLGHFSHLEPAFATTLVTAELVSLDELSFLRAWFGERE